MNIDESPCTRRTGRSSANQRSPGPWWIRRARDGPCGPATRSKIAAPIRPRICSAALATFLLSLRAKQAEAPADPGPEEIQDLDVTGDDADRIAAGDGISLNYSQIKVTYQTQ
jgi:hypothetical protein